MDDSLDQFKAGQKAGWVHFAPLQAGTTVPAARLVEHAGIRSGMRVLDVACGTGVVAITAARRGAQVTGLDLTPELLAFARQNAETAGVAVEWHEGDAERLPFPDASFDAVVSQFGHIFAPRPDVTLAEMLRVLKVGGVIAFSTWPPELLAGRIFALTARYLPPPPVAVPAPTLWGDANVVRARLGEAVTSIVFDRPVTSSPALSIPHAREAVERTVGPIVKLIEMLSATNPATLAAFREEHESIIADYYNENAVHQGYLMTRAVKR